MITNDVDKALVCTFASITAVSGLPTALGWGIDQCASVYKNGWKLRGYASNL